VRGGNACRVSVLRGKRPSGCRVRMCGEIQADAVACQRRMLSSARVQHRRYHRSLQQRRLRCSVLPPGPAPPETDLMLWRLSGIERIESSARYAMILRGAATDIGRAQMPASLPQVKE